MVGWIIKSFQKKLFIVFILVLGKYSSCAQSNEIKINQTFKSWVFVVGYGVQMSGIKNEDFISSNYSPVFRADIGKRIKPSVAIKIGYQGRYFNSIADDIKHYYNFYYTELVFDVKSILLKNLSNWAEGILFHLGPGCFYNFDYRKTTINGVIGGSYNFLITRRVNLSFDISAIIGREIYQENPPDILPSLSLGIIHLL